jgi:hypothetical protein
MLFMAGDIDSGSFALQLLVKLAVRRQTGAYAALDILEASPGAGMNKGVALGVRTYCYGHGMAKSAGVVGAVWRGALHNHTHIHSFHLPSIIDLMEIIIPNT